jgi:hypothetical protein
VTPQIRNWVNLRNIHGSIENFFCICLWQTTRVKCPFGIFFYLQGLHVTFAQEPGTKEKTSISVSCNILQLTTMANSNVKLDHLLFSLSTSVVDSILVTNRFPEWCWFEGFMLRKLVLIGKIVGTWSHMFKWVSASSNKSILPSLEALIFLKVSLQIHLSCNESSYSHRS